MPVKKQNIKSARKPVVRRGAVRAVEGQKMVSFWTAIGNFFKKYFQFSGVATRAEYWWVILFLAIVGIALIKLAFGFQMTNLMLAAVFAFLWLLFGIAVFVPLWALQARRLHDVGITAKILYVSFLFFVYSVLVPQVIRPIAVIDWISMIWGLGVLILFLFPSKKQNNPYRN